MRLRTVVAAALVGVFALMGGTAHGQSTPERRLTVAVGAISALNTYSNQRRAVYPEIEVYSSLYRSKAAGMTLGGSLYVAGWMDDGEGVAYCPHCINYSTRSAIVGARMAIRLDQFILGPLSFVGGLGHHWVWADYRSGGQYPSSRRDVRSSEFGLEGGVRIDIPISRRISIQPGGHLVLALPFNEYNPNFARIILAAGFSYSL